MVDEIFKIQNLTKRYLNVPQFKSEPNPMLGDDLRVSERQIFFGQKNSPQPWNDFDL